MPGMIQAEQDTEIRARVNSRKKAPPNAETAKALREGLRGEKLVRAGKSREEIRRALFG